MIMNAGGQLWRLDGDSALKHGSHGLLHTGQKIDVFGEDWRYDAVLGSGAYGIIIRGVSETRGNIALKFLKNRFDIARVRDSIEARKLHGASDVIVDYAHDRIEKDIVSMGYVDGASVGEQVKEMAERVIPEDGIPAISLEEFMNAVVTLRDMFEGVIEMEGKGVYHRDLKPANVMLVRGVVDPANFPGIPIEVIDAVKFGRAKIIDLDLFISAEDLEIEQQPDDLGNRGLTRGTMSYFGLEHLAGRMSLGSERYPVGRVISEMLVGKVGELRKLGVIQLAQKIASGKIYSDEQYAALKNLHKVKALEPVEKAARNMPEILEALQSGRIGSRLWNIQTAGELMKKLFLGGNLLAV